MSLKEYFRLLVPLPMLQGILLIASLIAYAQDRGKAQADLPNHRAPSLVTDFAQNSLDCVGHNNDGIGLMVKRRSDKKVISLNFCAAAEDSRYATVPRPSR